MAGPVPQRDIWWVELYGNAYSLEALPDARSAAVTHCIENFNDNGLADIGGLDEPFKEVSRLLEVAYYESVAKEMPSLENKVTDICFDITEICNKACNILTEFSVKSESACLSYKSSFSYLKDGFEDVARSQLESVIKNAAQLSSCFDKLKPHLDKCDRSVQDLLAWVTQEKLKLVKAREERQSFERDLDTATADRLNVETQLAAKGKEVSKCELVQNLCHGFDIALQIGDVVANTVQLFTLPIPTKAVVNGAVKIINVAQRLIKSGKPKEADLQLAKKKRADLEDAHGDVNRRIVNLAGSLERSREKEQTLVDNLLPLLQLLSQKLKIIRQKLMMACSFWERLQVVMSPAMDNERMIASVNAIPATKEERAEFWRSKAFAEDAISLYTRWLARHAVSNQCRKGVDQASRLLLELTAANATTEEAQTWLKQHL